MNNLVKIIKKCLPAVCYIDCRKKEKVKKPTAGKFYSGTYIPNFPKNKSYSVKMGGTGFIVDKSGIIFTNRHVIEDKNAKYKVILQNGEKYEPEIIAIDEINDVAILKINPRRKTDKSGLPCLPLGNSEKLNLGDSVIAIGNALGQFQNTVSTGIISGLSRSIVAQNKITNKSQRLRGLIQTDAAINPGNSGGPLISEKGEVLGINAAMIFGAENIGFALPINNAKKDLEDILNYGEIKEPFFGVRYTMIDEDIQEKFGLPISEGALVISERIPGKKERGVVFGSPAHKGGIKEGDIIVEVSGEKINQKNALTETLYKKSVGKTILVKYIRNKKEKKTRVRLTEKQ